MEMNYELKDVLSALMPGVLSREETLLSDQEMMVLLLRNPELAQRLLTMTNSEVKKHYVDQRHKQKLSQLKTKNPARNGYWCTHIYVNGKRKEVERATVDKLYDFLFDFYQGQENRNKTYEDIFSLFIESKREFGRSELTIKDYQRYHGFLPESIKHKDIALITEDEIRKWFVMDFLTKTPKKEAMKKMLQLIQAVFTLAMDQGFCFANPAKRIYAKDYFKFCDLSTKSNEEKSFSSEDLDKLRTYCLKDKKNPHAVMMLLAMETGMRVGELAALKKEDIEDGFLHVHRQQVIQFDSEDDTKRHWEDVEYTKNERTNPKGGRLVPITARCQSVLNIALELPGDSDYVFHHPDGRPLLKDSYLYYLRRRCKALGIKISHNHAFRVAYNAKLIEAGVDGNERCLVLGHSMQTNERHYSFSDRRKAEDVKNKLNELEMA